MAHLPLCGHTFKRRSLFISIFMFVTVFAMSDIFFFTSLKYRQRILLFTLFSPFFQTGTLIRFGSGQILSGDNLGYKTCFLYRLRQFIDSFPKGINTLIVCIFFGFVLLIGGLEFDPGPGRPLPPGRVCVSRR